jgi:hypothetical protein
MVWNPGGLPMMLTRIFALTLALLTTVTIPAYATTIAVEDINLNFGNGYEEKGLLGVNIFKFWGISQYPDLFYNGVPVPFTGFSDGEPNKLFQFAADGDHTLTIPGNFPGLPVSFWALDGVAAVSGDVKLVSLSYVPLPAALPLFGSGVIALAGVARRKQRRDLCRGVVKRFRKNDLNEIL